MNNKHINNTAIIKHLFRIIACGKKQLSIIQNVSTTFKLAHQLYVLMNHFYDKITHKNKCIEQQFQDVLAYLTEHLKRLFSPQMIVYI